MHVTRLELHDFRSYPRADVALTRGPTAFIGANGQGKTNLVEAIDYVGGLESHRVAADAPLIRAGTQQAVVPSKGGARTAGASDGSGAVPAARSSSRRRPAW